MKTIKLLAILFISSLAITSCSSDDDGGGENDEELITTVVYTLTNDANATDIVVLEFTDLDGEGGNDGTYDISGPLTANATYSGRMQLWNATENPPEDINEEIVGEADEHEFFYTNTAGLTITKTDTDEDGNPLGIDTMVTTGAAGNGNIVVILKHEPSKPNDGTATGAGGSTDVEVSYAVTVQ
jgi:hypothetical protein